MDKINFDRSGGYYLNLQDLEFNNDGIANLIKGFCRMQMQSGDTYTWFGNAELDNDTLHVDEGLIYDATNDELFYIPSMNVSAGFSGNYANVYLYVVETSDSYTTTFLDGNTWQPRKYRRIQFNNSSYSGAGISSFRGLTLADLISQKKGAIPYGMEDSTGDGKFRRMMRWKTYYSASDFNFNNYDTNREISLLSNYGGTNTITMPTEKYIGEQIQIVNTSGNDATITGIETLSNGSGGTYAVSNSSVWYKVYNWDVSD